MQSDKLKAALSRAEEVPSSSIQKENEVEIICMSDIEMKAIQWLWLNFIALGKITVIAGNPGLGKSQFTMYLAATVSQGAPWHHTNTLAPRGNVIILSAEDDAADTIKPRLIAAGADVSHCYILDAIRITKAGKMLARGFDLTQDIERLGQAITRLGDVRLIVIDPISAYMGNTDSHNNAEVRGLLAPLSDLAAKYQVAIVLLTHLNKSTQQDAIGRVMGSIGLVAAARAGYMVVKDETTPDNRYFIPIKSNVEKDRDGFAFHIEGVELPEGIKTSKICWHDGKVDAQKILYPGKEQKPTATNEVQVFLKTLLASKSMMAKEVFAEAEGFGHSESSVQRAANKIGVKRKKQGKAGGWLWSLPTLDTYGKAIEGSEDSEDSNDSFVPHSEEEVQLS